MSILTEKRHRVIGAAYEGAFALTQSGRVYAWGDNEASGLGFQGTGYGVQKIVRTPARVENLDPYASQIIYIAGGNGWGEALSRYAGSVALTNDGAIYMWGQAGGSAFKNIYGESPAPRITRGAAVEIGGGKEPYLL